MKDLYLNYRLIIFIFSIIVLPKKTYKGHFITDSVQSRRLTLFLSSTLLLVVDYILYKNLKMLPSELSYPVTVDNEVFR